MAWFGDDAWTNAGQLAVFLESWLQKNDLQRSKIFLIYTNPTGRSSAEVTKLLEEFSRKNGLHYLAVLHVPSPTDKPTSFLYGINPRAARCWCTTSGGWGISS